MKLKNDLKYLWIYYKWQILAALVVVILSSHFLITAFSQKECALSIMLLDCYTEVSDEKMEKELLQSLQLDQKKYVIEVQNSLMIDNTESGNYAMTSLSRFMSDVGSEKLDVCGMLQNSYLKYDYSRTFLDLRECFTEEQLSEIEEALLVTEDGRVIGIYADALDKLQEDGCYDSEDERGVVGIVYNTKHLDMAVNYLLYLMN